MRPERAKAAPLSAFRPQQRSSASVAAGVMTFLKCQASQAPSVVKPLFRCYPVGARTAFALTGRVYLDTPIPRAMPWARGFLPRCGVPWAKRAFRGLPLGHPCPMRGAVTPTATEEGLTVLSGLFQVDSFIDLCYRLTSGTTRPSRRLMMRWA